jgi:hypothetical protein
LIGDVASQSRDLRAGNRKLSFRFIFSRCTGILREVTDPAFEFRLIQPLYLLSLTARCDYFVDTLVTGNCTAPAQSSPRRFSRAAGFRADT